MEYLGSHNKRKVYWYNYSEETFAELPDNNWICLAIENGLHQKELFEKFVRVSIQKNILEFKAHGNLSSHLDDDFDHIIVEMEVVEGHSEIDVATTWYNKEGLASAFWQCFHATCLPDNADTDNLKIVCLHFDNIDFRSKLKDYLKRFKQGWSPLEQD